MSILVEALSVVIPRHVLEAGYPGGTEGYLETARRARGTRYAISDDRLACVSFASPADADAFTAPLSALGLGVEDGAPAPVACLDEDFGPTAACPWLRWRRHDDGFTSCWLEWTEPGELATPPDWLPPRQRSQSARPLAARPVAPEPVDVAPTTPTPATVAHETPPPLRIVPTTIGPLTPISSPAILAAMDRHPSNNGHALLDADSIDVDSLVANADDAFSSMGFNASSADDADQELGDDWSLPELESNEDDTSIHPQTTTDSAIDEEYALSDDEEDVEAAEAFQALVVAEPVPDAQDDAPELSVVDTDDLTRPDNSIADQDAAAAHGFTNVDAADAMDAMDAMDVEAVEELTVSEDMAASAEFAASEDDLEADQEKTVLTPPEVVGENVENVIDEPRIADDATGHMYEDSTPFDGLADVDALVSVIVESGEPAATKAPTGVREIEAAADTAPADESPQPSMRKSSKLNVFNGMKALFAPRDQEVPASPDREAQSAASASPDDDDAAIIPASLTPVAMTAVSVAPAPTAVFSSGSPLDAVRAHLAERGWRCSQDDDQGALFYQTVGGRASYPGFAAADESAQLVWLYTQIPVRVPEHRRAAAVELLTRANHGLAVGNFEFDYSDGEVRFKAVADSADGCFSEASAGRLLRHSLEACDRYHDALMQVIYGGLSPADAVR